MDKTNWPPGEWIDEPDYLEWTDEETGYICIIKRVGAILEGYVGIPANHVYVTIPDDEDSLHSFHYDLDVHGGISRAEYNEDNTIYFLGFDCGHLSDFDPYGSVHEIDGTHRFRPCGRPQDYRNIDYVKNEIYYLINQLKNIKKIKKY